MKERASERSKVISNYVKNNAIDIQLSCIPDFLEWYMQVSSVMMKCSISLYQNLLLVQMKNSISNKEDVAVIKPMTGLNQAVNYLHTKFEANSRLALLNLSPLKALRIPGNDTVQSLKNVNLILHKLKICLLYTSDAADE